MYYQVGTVKHKTAMNAFLKEASEYDKMSNNSRDQGRQDLNTSNEKQKTNPPKDMNESKPALVQ